MITINLIDTLGNKTANSLNTYLNKNEIESQKLKYGIKILFITLSKISMLLLAAYFFGIFKYTFIFFLCFSIIRSFAFGIHASTSLACTLSNLIIFLGGTYSSIHIELNKYEIIFLFIISFILLFLYAPADTKARPLISKDFRKKLKIKSLIVWGIFLIIALNISNGIYGNIITLSVLIEGVCITPLIYKLFRKEYKNYEKVN